MEFQNRYNNFQRELLELKTGHDARSNMRTFYEEITVQESPNYSPTTIRVTYADGDQPIMTTIVSVPEIIPLAPSGNVQDFYIAYGDNNYYLDKTIVSILSTRKINSIQIIQ